MDEAEGEAPAALAAGDKPAKADKPPRKGKEHAAPAKS
jgi:hypothetical protein